MAAPGGSSTITGVEIELWFTSLKFAELFFEDNMTVTPQALTNIDTKTGEVNIISVDDLHIKKGSKDYFFNIKYRSPNITHWTVSSLANTNVISDFLKQHQQNPDSKLYFVTQSPCSLFQEVIPRAREAHNRKDIEIRLKTKTKKYLKEWDDLKKRSGFDDSALIRFSKNLHYKHIIDTDEIKKLITDKFKGHVRFHQTVLDHLFQLSIDAAKFKKTINKTKVIVFLEEKGITRKSHLALNTIIDQFKLASSTLTT